LAAADMGTLKKGKENIYGEEEREKRML